MAIEKALTPHHKSVNLYRYALENLKRYGWSDRLCSAEPYLRAILLIAEKMELPLTITLFGVYSPPFAVSKSKIIPLVEALHSVQSSGQIISSMGIKSEPPPKLEAPFYIKLWQWRKDCEACDVIRVQQYGARRTGAKPNIYRLNMTRILNKPTAHCGIVKSIWEEFDWEEFLTGIYIEDERLADLEISEIAESMALSPATIEAYISWMTTKRLLDAQFEEAYEQARVWQHYRYRTYTLHHEPLRSPKGHILDPALHTGSNEYEHVLETYFGLCPRPRRRTRRYGGSPASP